jgi:hypothetical protein
MSHGRKYTSDLDAALGQALYRIETGELTVPTDDTNSKTELELWDLIHRRTDVVPGQVWKHEKTGQEYTVTDIVIREADCAPLVVYARFDNYLGIPWTRPVPEFLDGRFKLVKNVANPSVPGPVVDASSLEPVGIDQGGKAKPMDQIHYPPGESK